MNWSRFSNLRIFVAMLVQSKVAVLNPGKAFLCNRILCGNDTSFVLVIGNHLDKYSYKMLVQDFYWYTHAVADLNLKKLHMGGDTARLFRILFTHRRETLTCLLSILNAVKIRRRVKQLSVRVKRRSSWLPFQSSD